MQADSEKLRSPVLIVVSAVALAMLVLTAICVAVIRFGGAADVGDLDALVVEPAPSSAGLPSARPAQQAGSRSAERTTTVDAGWLRRTAAKTGIPLPALRAYADAQLRLAKEQPHCHVGWNTLAGIGYIESHHGTIGGRTLNENGTSSTTILGPALDGTAFAAIRATPESTSWHGDPTWDHAVGPLQFLSSTWDRWGTDGDGDGVADPRDLDDAALTAGRYLCADAHDLSTDSGWSRAVHSYNHDMAYVANVANVANTYAGRAT